MMTIELLTEAFEEHTTDALVVGVTPEQSLFPATLPAKLDQELARCVQDEHIEGKAGQLNVWSNGLRDPIRRVFLVGLGPTDSLSGDVLRRAAALAARQARARAVQRLTFPLLDSWSLESLEETAQCFVEGSLLGGYVFSQYRKKDKKSAFPGEVVLLHPEGKAQEKIQERLVVARLGAEGTTFARDLVNEPGNVLTPEVLAQRAMEIAQNEQIECSVLGLDQIQRLKMGAFLAVAQGGANEPRFIHLIYHPASPTHRIGLVGKGVTFDSGGLSLKGSKYMEDMKSDMAGAATVLGVMMALAGLNLDVEVHGFIAATENMPDGSATKPGDIVRSLSGKSIEILNTDAEGRLTLADALHYAQEQEKLDLLVNVATLTGACVVALGTQCAGLMGNDRSLVQALLASSARTGEMVWELPLIDAYDEALKSSIADVKNTGGRWAGAINAGLFLRRFIGEKTRWAHLDIAGPAFLSKAEGYCPEGGSGFGVRLLLDFIQNYSPDE